MDGRPIDPLVVARIGVTHVCFMSTGHTGQAWTHVSPCMPLCVCVCVCVCVKVEFIGLRGASHLSDIAIDNLQIRSDACPGGQSVHSTHTCICRRCLLPINHSVIVATFYPRPACLTSVLNVFMC